METGIVPLDEELDPRNPCDIPLMSDGAAFAIPAHAALLAFELPIVPAACAFPIWVISSAIDTPAFVRLLFRFWMAVSPSTAGWKSWLYSCAWRARFAWYPCNPAPYVDNARLNTSP